MNSLSIEIRPNGVLPAFMHELGCRCPRCLDPDPRQRNNTSTSIIVRDAAGILIAHLVVDLGLGVPEELARQGGPWPRPGASGEVGILLSHRHKDHLLGIDAASNSYARALASAQVGGPASLPVYAVQETWDRGPLSIFPYLASAGKSPAKIVHAPIHPGVPFFPAGVPNLRVTPVPVVHFGQSVIFVIEFFSAGPFERLADYKAILAYDLLRLLQPDEDRYIADLGEDGILFKGADLLVIESNTWNPHPETGHISWTEARELVSRWCPREVCVVHYSGHEDRGEDPLLQRNDNPAHGPVSAFAFEAALRCDTPDIPVHVGSVGQSFHFPPAQRLSELLVIVGPAGVGKTPLGRLLEDVPSREPYRLRANGPRDKKDRFYAPDLLDGQLRSIARSNSEGPVSLGADMEWFRVAGFLLFKVRGERQVLFPPKADAPECRLELYAPVLEDLLSQVDGPLAEFRRVRVLILNPASHSVVDPAVLPELEAITRDNCSRRGDTKEQVDKRVQSLHEEAPSWARLAPRAESLEIVGWPFFEYTYRLDAPAKQSDILAHQRAQLRAARRRLIDDAPDLDRWMMSEAEIDAIQTYVVAPEQGTVIPD